MSMRVIVFDLDNTLYDELDYARSGVSHVAHEMALRYGWDEQDTVRQMQASLVYSRENIFERVLQQKGALSADMLAECLGLYRTHVPSIRLSNRVKRLLKSLARTLSIYVLNVGDAVEQTNKTDVLGLERMSEIKGCFQIEANKHLVMDTVERLNQIAEIESCDLDEISFITANQAFVPLLESYQIGQLILLSTELNHQDKSDLTEAQDVFNAVEILDVR